MSIESVDGAEHKKARLRKEGSRSPLFLNLMRVLMATYKGKDKPAIPYGQLIGANP